MKEEKAQDWLTSFLKDANLEQPISVDCRFSEGKFTGVMEARFSSPTVVQILVEEVSQRNPHISGADKKVSHVWCKPFGYPSLDNRRNPWRPSVPKHNEALNCSASDSQLLSSIKKQSFVKSPWGRQVKKLDESLSALGRQNPKKVKHRGSGGFQKPVDFKMYSWQALQGDVMHREHLTLADAKKLCGELREKGCVGFMVDGRPSSWRLMEFYFMSKVETEPRDRWYSFVFDDAKENKLIRKIRGEMVDHLALQAMEKEVARPKLTDLSHVIEQGRADSSMQQLGQAMRQVETQRKKLQSAQRKRTEQLRTARKSPATSSPAIPSVDLSSCQAAVQEAERACQTVYEQKVFDARSGIHHMMCTDSSVAEARRWVVMQADNSEASCTGQAAQTPKE